MPKENCSSIITDGPEALSLECKNTEISFLDNKTKKWFKFRVMYLVEVHEDKWDIIGTKANSKIFVIHYNVANKRGTCENL